MPSQTLANLSNQLLGSGTNNLFNFNFSSFKLIGTEASDMYGIETVGSFANSLKNTIGDIAQLTRTAYCIGSVITDWKSMMNVLDQIGGQLAAVAYDMANRVFAVIQGQINQIVGNVVGTAINVISSVLSFLQSILNLVDALVNLWQTISEMTWDSLKQFFQQEQCEFILAQMAMCMLNKLFGSKLQEWESKLTSKIVETGQKWNEALTQELKPTNDIANFVRHESFMVDKAAAQINMIGGIF